MEGRKGPGLSRACDRLHFGGSCGNNEGGYVAGVGQFVVTGVQFHPRAPLDGRGRPFAIGGEREECVGGKVLKCHSALRVARFVPKWEEPGARPG